MTLTLDPWLAALLPKAEHLPSLPGAALEVLRLCRAEDTTLDDLSQAISRDPALSARLLRFANSSLYGPSEEVRTVPRATLVLGLKSVQLMSLSFSLVAAVPREGTAGAFDYARFWRRSLVRSVSARALARHAGLLAQDEAFLAGLLGEFGQVALARCAPEAYARVLAHTRELGHAWPREETERELLHTTQAEVGHALLSAWQVPAHIALAVRHMARPEELPADTPNELGQLVGALAAARPVTDLLTLDGGEPALRQALELAQRHLGLSGDDLRTVLSELDGPLRETASLLDLSLSQQGALETLLSQAHERLLELSLGHGHELASLQVALDPEPRARLLAEPGSLDALTGLASAEAAARFLEHQLAARRTGVLQRSLGFALIALDAFDTYPDEEARDEAQRAVAGLLTRVLRRNDLAARLAPGRFALILGDATPYGSRALGERLLCDARALKLTLASGVHRPSFSLGAACLASSRSPSDGPALRAVVERLLARAQQRGPAALEVHPQPLTPGG